MVSKKNVRLWEKSDLWSKKPQFHGYHRFGKSPKRVLEKREIYPVSQAIGIKELSFDGSPNFFVSYPVEEVKYLPDYYLHGYLANSGATTILRLYCQVDFKLFPYACMVWGANAAEPLASFYDSIPKTFRLKAITEHVDKVALKDHFLSLGIAFTTLHKRYDFDSFDFDSWELNCWDTAVSGVPGTVLFNFDKYFDLVRRFVGAPNVAVYANEVSLEDMVAAGASPNDVYDPVTVPFDPFGTPSNVQAAAGWSHPWYTGNFEMHPYQYMVWYDTISLYIPQGTILCESKFHQWMWAKGLVPLTIPMFPLDVFFVIPVYNAVAYENIDALLKLKPTVPYAPNLFYTKKFKDKTFPKLLSNPQNTQEQPWREGFSIIRQWGLDTSYCTGVLLWLQKREHAMAVGANFTNFVGWTVNNYLARIIALSGVLS